jgi:hypothetical protein
VHRPEDFLSALQALRRASGRISIVTAKTLKATVAANRLAIS